MRLSKSLRFVSHMARYFAEAAKIKLTSSNDAERLRKYSQNASKYSKLALANLRIKIDLKYTSEIDFKKRNYLMVSNHMSYLDAVITSSIQPCLFVTSVDMGEKFFIGTFAEMGGSIFIERRNRSRVEGDRSAITKALKEGFNVVIYPEGTSTDGSKVLPFKKSLLTAAAEAGVEILPMAVKYKEINGQSFQPGNCDKVCWYGSMDFLSHIQGVIGLDSCKVEVSFLPPIQTNPNSTRDELADSAFSAVSNSYHGIRTELSTAN
jgi:lyso-ornithine lipid O-acyltransferase